MAGRADNSESYRYGFNGMEKDNEVIGDANSYTTEFRTIDVRIGRWWSLDSITHEFQSPYCTFDNNPIYYKDPSGADGEDPITHTTKEGETLWNVAKDFYNENGYSDKTWEEYWKDVWSWNKNGDYGKIGGTMNLSDPNNCSNSKRTFLDDINYVETVGSSSSIDAASKQLESPQPDYSVKPKNKLRAGLADSEASALIGYSWSRIAIHVPPGSGYWEEKVELDVTGVTVSFPGINLISASIGKVNINQEYINSNSLTKIMNSSTYMNSSSFQGGFKYEKISGFNNMSEMDNVWTLYFGGFGLGVGVGGSRSNLSSSFRPSTTMSHEDSLRKSIIEILYKGEFEQFLIKEYGSNYLDSISQ
jgi:RHS repeat-associated protein